MRSMLQNILLFLIKRLLRCWFKLTQSDPDGSMHQTICELIENKNEEGESIDTDEKILLGNVLDLKETPVSEVMISRAEIVAVSIDTSVNAILDLMHQKSMSRLLVYKENIDNTLGFVAIEDLVVYVHKPDKFNIKNHIRKIAFVASSMRTLDLLLQLREQGEKMALVVDEHGSVDGIVTFSNLVEEIIGEIKEVDTINPPGRMNVKENGDIIVDGHAKLKDVNERFDLHFIEEDEVTTVAGMISAIAGHMPARGELIQDDSGITFLVMDATPRKVKTVCIRLPKKHVS